MNISLMDLGISTELLTAVICFALAALVLEFFDISLPRGDSVGVSGALNSAALIMIGPGAALASGLIGAISAFVVRPRRARTASPVIELSALSGGLCAALLTDSVIRLPLNPSGLIRNLEVLVVAAAYLLTDLIVVQLLVSRASRRSPIRMILASGYRQAPLLLAQLSACLLTILIYPTMLQWSLVLVVVLLLLIRQSYALLLDTRDTYRTTVQVIVEAAEATDLRRSGHSERTATIAREIGVRCGISPTEIERVSYAALLHDIDAIGSESNETPEMSASEVLNGLETFSDLIPVLKVFEDRTAYAGCSQADALAAFIVALSSEIDASTHPALGLVHAANETQRLSSVVPVSVKARVVASALKLGYGVPAIP